MSDDPHSVVIARLSLRQGVIVASIAGVVGVLTTLISTGALQPRRGGTALNDLAPAQRIPASNEASLVELQTLRRKLRDYDSVQNDLTVARTQLAEALKVRSKLLSSPTIDTVVTELRRNLAGAQQEVRRLSATEQALKSDIVSLKQERDELRTGSVAPQAHAWFRQATTPDNVCVSHAAAALKKVGSDELHYSGSGVSGGKDGTLFMLNCDDTVMVIAVSLDGTAAEEWRDKLREAFLAEEK
jgi:hypothetical protein